MPPSLMFQDSFTGHGGGPAAEPAALDDEPIVKQHAHGRRSDIGWDGPRGGRSTSESDAGLGSMRNVGKTLFLQVSL